MQLWSDLDNANNDDEQQASGSTRSTSRGRRGQTRRLSEQVVFSTLREWLLGDYVPSYCRALAATRIYRRCYLIDALGSNTAGIKKPAPELDTPGSATLASLATLSHALAQEQPPITLHGLVLKQGSSTRRDAHAQQHALNGERGDEPDTGNGRNAEASVQAITQGMMRQGKKATTQRVVLSTSKANNGRNGGESIAASWLEVAPTLLPAIEQSPAILLLNPFGHAMFTANDLNALYKRTAPTELCLMLSLKQVEMLLLTALRSPAYAIALNAVLRTDKWKTLLVQDETQQKRQKNTRNAENTENNRNTINAVNTVIDLFSKAIQRHFTLPVQRIALPIYTRPAVVEHIPYVLLFATRRQDSFVLMNDALCRYRQHVFEQSLQGVLAQEWFAAQQQTRREEARVQLRDAIIQRGKAQRARRWPDLRQQVLLDHFGQFLLSEYDTVLQSLIADHIVTCEWRRTPPTENAIPGNDDILLW